MSISLGRLATKDGVGRMITDIKGLGSSFEVGVRTGVGADTGVTSTVATFFLMRAGLSGITGRFQVRTGSLRVRVGIFRWGSRESQGMRQSGYLNIN